MIEGYQEARAHDRGQDDLQTSTGNPCVTSAPPTMPMTKPDGKALLAILVLPIDRRSNALSQGHLGLRSFRAILLVLSELLIDPVAPIATPPDFSKDKAACNRASRDHHRP
jgi:hypothetical protein